MTSHLKRNLKKPQAFRVDPAGDMALSILFLLLLVAVLAIGGGATYPF